MAEPRCMVCDARFPVALAAPASRGMLSDGEPRGVPVARLSCRRCGTAALHPASLKRLPRQIFGAGYRLNAGPSGADEVARQDGYARRIAALFGATPDSVLDVGCGNGALLLALGRLWPGARRRGMEPAPGAAGAARRAGLDVRQSLAAGARAALVVSVNVIEHTADPLSFLRRLRRACAPGGAIVLICPDATTPWLEMLMLDHRHCLTAAALPVLAARAGLAVLAHQRAGEGGFQALLLRPALPRRARPAWPAMDLVARRRRYLGAWRGLDRDLLARAEPPARLICFGSGEAARLLRCHAPATWAAVVAVTADDTTGAAALGKPVIALDDVAMGRDGLLLAVRPQAQAALAARFEARGARVLRWDGRIAR